jgi:thiol-disulfide isomerase/thioredoxin
VAVQSTGPGPTATASARPTAEAVAPAPRGPLCGGKLRPEGRTLPSSDISRASAPGVPEPPAAIAVTGKWTWVNFWAAWCVPCKEEIPRLLAWEQKLKQAGTAFQVRFVSLDDDARQLREFLAAQPAGGLRATYWLQDGKERERWLRGVGMNPDPQLPAHLIVDPQGQVRCIVGGAVEDADYGSLASLLVR